VKSGVVQSLSICHVRAYILYMKKELRSAFRRALKLAAPQLPEVAKGVGRSVRAVQMYRDGDRRVTPDAARRFARWLRRRARRLDKAADDLERAARKEESDG
jgi:Sec-independent protein translocase protein TatA